jgi:hypothetical protein
LASFDREKRANAKHKTKQRRVPKRDHASDKVKALLVRALDTRFTTFSRDDSLVEIKMN